MDEDAELARCIGQQAGQRQAIEPERAPAASQGRGRKVSVELLSGLEKVGLPRSAIDRVSGVGDACGFFDAACAPSDAPGAAGLASLVVSVDGQVVEALASTMAATEFYQTYSLRGLAAGTRHAQLDVTTGTLVVDAVAVVP